MISTLLKKTEALMVFGGKEKIYNEKEITYPVLLNLFLAPLSYGCVIAILYFASHTTSWPLLLAYALVFSLFANTVFSFLHESVHSSFHQNKKINNL